MNWLCFFAVLTACFLCLISPKAEAQFGNSCTSTGISTITISSSGQLLYCNGSTWGLAETITSTGNIGIGTTAPASMLEIDAPPSTRPLLVTGTSGFAAVEIQDTGASGLIWELQSDSSGNLNVVDRSTNTTEATFSATGDILSVKGNEAVAGILNVTSGIAGNALAVLSGNTSNAAAIGLGRGTNEFSIVVPSTAGSWDSGAIAGDLVFRGGGGNYRFATGSGADIMSILNSGNVGIGTTSPQAMLDVNGYARLMLNSSSPATCSGTNQGAVALNHLAQLCACNGSAWVFADSTGAACSW